MKAVRKHTDCKWVVLYIERWLTAPAQLPDGTPHVRDKGTPQGGVISPLLANLFLHYAFDAWMERNFPTIGLQMGLDELRSRIPDLRSRETRLKAELEALTSELEDQATYLRLAHTLGDFLARLRNRAQDIDTKAQQKIVRLLVKEVVVGEDSITIRHSIPSSQRPLKGFAEYGEKGGKTTDSTGVSESYLLCTGRERATLRRTARPSSFWGVRRTRSLSHCSMSFRLCFCSFALPPRYLYR